MFPKAILEFAKRIAELEPDATYAPVTPRALLVGGYVRDRLLGKEVKDIDLEVYGVHPDKLHSVVKEMFPRVDLVGSSFGILKVYSDEYEIDIGTPRRESKVGKGHRGFVTESAPEMSFREAARRRDFTVNAISLDPLTEVLHDPYQGQVHLEAKVLQVVDTATFQEDPLRVFRGIQLAARLGFTLEDKTFALMTQMIERGDLNELPKERVSDEWRKLLLKATLPSVGFRLMWALGIIEKYYPELFVLKTTDQEPEWHPEGDVWTHSLMVIDQAAKLILDRQLTLEDQLTVMLGALCHDLGKATTTAIIDGRIRSRGHEEAGEKPTRSLLKKFTFGREIEDSVVRIVKDHLKPSMLYRELQLGHLNDESYVYAVRRLLRRLGETSFEVYLKVTEADVRGRGVKDATTAPYLPGEVMRQAVAQNSLLESIKTPLLTGGEIIDLLGLEPGPKVGELQRMLEEARDHGKVTTRDQAIRFLKKRVT